jgi:hypothetical protein
VLYEIMHAFVLLPWQTWCACMCDFISQAVHKFGLPLHPRYMPCASQIRRCVCSTTHLQLAAGTMAAHTDQTGHLLNTWHP